MRQALTTSFVFRLLVSPAIRLRLIRHTLLWTTALGVMVASFYFLSRTIKDTSGHSVFIYTLLSTLVVGGLTISIYGVVTTLAHRFILLQFRPGRFVLGIFLTYVVAAELVLLHFTATWTISS